MVPKMIPFRGGLAVDKVPLSGLGEIGSIGDLDLKNYRIGFCRRYIDIDNYRIGFLKMLPFEVRNVKIKLIQFNTMQYKMVLFRGITKLYRYMFQFSICTQFLCSKLYQTDNFLLKMISN
jgi:hypothetical protein